jgi:excisionase family DNA binding protein
MISRRELRAYRIGRHIRIDPADLGKARTPVTAAPAA